MSWLDHRGLTLRDLTQATWISGHRLCCRLWLAHLVRQLRDQDEPRWTLGRLGTPCRGSSRGQSPARPAVDILFGVRLRRYGIDAHADCSTARIALAAGLPASVLADLTGISISTAERWSQGPSETGPPTSASAPPTTARHRHTETRQETH